MKALGSFGPRGDECGTVAAEGAIRDAGEGLANPVGAAAIVAAAGTAASAVVCGEAAAIF